MIIENSKSKIEIHNDYVLKCLKNQNLDNRWFDVYSQLSKENDFLVKVYEQKSRSKVVMEKIEIITDLDRLLKDETYYYLLDQNLVCDIIKIFNKAFTVGTDFSKSLDKEFFYHTDLHFYNFVLTTDKQIKLLDPDSFRFQKNFDHAYRYFQSQIFLMNSLQRYYYVSAK